jgi:peptidoglycan/LPS O-acetylase OafA/YrhL
MNPSTSPVRAVAALGILFWLASGLWAFASPSSFYDAVATYPPYNAHFLRDAGAFMLGLGGALGLGLWWRDALAAALGGSAVGGALHVAAHVIDRHQGGSLGDTLALTVLALAFATAAVAQRRRAPG